MMNNQATYKRVKVNWWIIILFGGIYVWIIFAYIYQWGNDPIDKSAPISIGILYLVVLLFMRRFTLIIDDKYVIFKTDLWTPLKLHIAKIKEVSIEEVFKNPMIIHISVPGKNSEKFTFDFFRTQGVSIKLKNDYTYKIAIKNAKRIKEEIEKRMITNK